MFGDQKKEPRQGVRAKSGSKGSAGKSGAVDPAEKMQRQHKANWENAQLIVRHAMDTLKMTRVDKSLIEIFKTVRHWPSLINEHGSHAFDPGFNATEISAQASAQDDETTLNVSFSYMGNTYELVCSLTKNSSVDLAPGNMSLHENGEWVIDFKLLHNDSHDLYSLSELKALKVGDWIDNIKSIEAEIQAHDDKDG